MLNENEKISALIDGDIDLLEHVGDVAGSDSARATWSRYHLIGDVVRDRMVDVAPANFSLELAAKIEHEPTALAPRRSQAVPSPQRRPLLGYAIAASVAMMAVLLVQQFTSESASIEQAAVATTVTRQVVEPALVVGASNPAQPTAYSPESLQAQRRLNGYLVKFNEQRSNLGVPSVNPYVRIVGFEAE